MAFACGNSSRLIFMLILVAVYFLVELIVGHVINSVALVADAFHMLSDLFALVVGLIAARIAKWPRSSKNTFGWQRAEVMGGLINTVMLITLCGTIFLEAIERFAKPKNIDNPRLMIYVGAGGLLVNLLGLIVLGAHSHDKHPTSIEVIDGDINGTNALRIVGEQNIYAQPRSLDGSVIVDRKVVPVYPSEVQMLANQTNGPRKPTKMSEKSQEKSQKGKRTSSMNMRAVFLHVLADFFGSIIVVLSAAILEFVPGKDAVWKLYIDPSMSVVMVLIILASAIPLMYKTALILLQSVPSEISIKNLKNRLENIDGIHKVHDLHVWRLQSNCIIGTVHIRCVSLPDYLNIARKVKELFHEFDIHCTTIQPEFEECGDEDTQGEIDYQTCVLDCGPNTKCQSDTCCPAPTCIGVSSTQSSSSSNKTPPAGSDAVDLSQVTHNGPSSSTRIPGDSDEVRVQISNMTNHTDSLTSTPTA